VVQAAFEGHFNFMVHLSARCISARNPGGG
jgi:hypothetical protein